MFLPRRDIAFGGNSCNVFASSGISINACLIQIACLMQVATKTGFTGTCDYRIKSFNSESAYNKYLINFICKQMDEMIMLILYWPINT